MLYRQSDVRMSIVAQQNPPEESFLVPLMPLRDVVIFPSSLMSLFVGRVASGKAIDSAVERYDKRICLVTQRESDLEKPTPEDLFSVGVTARILQVLRLPDNTVKALFEGVQRVTWTPKDAISGDFEAYPLVHATPLRDLAYDAVEGEALVRLVHEALEAFASKQKRIPPEALAALSGLRDPARLADMIMPHMKMSYPEKQAVLEMLHPVARLEKVYELLAGEIIVSDTEKRVKMRVKEQMEHNQREYYLTEQVKAIHKELGREDDPVLELDEIAVRFAEKNMPKEAYEKALRELKRLKSMSMSSPEYSMTRGYLDWLLDLPWNDLKESVIDIDGARKVLDADHFGLEKPKQRILEYLAVHALTNSLQGPILCLVGPPGVGKTSLAKSVATATGRDFVRLSLGGIRDEAEIRGHRRTYIGAMPGKIIMSLKRIKSNNPVFCLDEIDKMSSDFRGDPSAALLEVLDPEQNAAFNDHYLDLDYDLSQVFFIATANSLHSIPEPLKDRMEIIELSSYLDVEKRQIARDFLLPKQIEKHGLQASNLSISDGALQSIMQEYTREAGVRSLERELAALCRKTAIKLVESKNTSKRVQVTRQNLASFLGVKKYRTDNANQIDQVGLVNGLAYTGRGGALLLVEAAIMPGKGKVVTTGKLGDVMTESAKAAVSYIRARTDLFGLRPDFHNLIDIHLHFPDGATPKDGPSAGIAITTALVSALLAIPCCHDVAMTGEVTLRGRVLPIGGLREKLLAATRGGIKRVIIPKDNEKDLKEVPEEIVRRLDIHFVEHVDDVLALALVGGQDRIFDRTEFPHLAISLRRSDPCAEIPAQ